MLRNYLKIALRNLLNQKFYSIINIIGLSIGITACILVALYIRQDLSYDRYHENAGQIYRVFSSNTHSGVTLNEAETPALLGPTLKNEYPEIKKFTRIFFSNNNLVEAATEKYFEDRISYADSSFFEIFSYKTILGNKEHFLKKPNSVVITESAANKYFKNENPVGKEIIINNKNRLEVVGIIEDVPINSHFKFDFIITYSSLSERDEAIYLPQWGATFGSYTYILVEKDFNPAAFEKKSEDFFGKHTKLSSGEIWKVLVQPLLDIHLKSHLPDEIEENSSISKIIILGSIALFILLLACINFINLTTARSVKRAGEIGIRKVFGAFKIQLILQFLGESVMLSFISLIISLITVIEVIPYFSTLVGTDIQFDPNNTLSTLLIIVGGVMFIGLLAGIYPALIISSYRPIKVLKGSKFSTERNRGSLFLRKGLVILQFGISIIFITGTIIVSLQLKYMHNFNMGFDKDYMLVIPAIDRIGEKYTTIKTELNSIPGVKNITACFSAPISENKMNCQCKPNGREGSESFIIGFNSIDFDFIDHFGIKLIAGRNFSDDFSDDFTKVMVINEKMAKSLGYNNAQDAIGKSYFISLNGYKPEIIGVVKDYNSNSLHSEVKPQIFLHIPRLFSEFVVKVNSAGISSTVNNLKDVWARFFPQYPFKYYFLDESIDAMYKSEERYSEVISVFSIIAIFIACLGLLGLTSFVTEQRKKEIGVRKVLGASITNILQIISSEFIKLVIISNIIAWPIAYYLMNNWLQDFAYRININLWAFILSGSIALIISITTVCFQSIKAAIANPVESLRSE